MMKIFGIILSIFMSFAGIAQAADTAKAESVLFAPPTLNRDITLQRADFDKQTILVNETPLNDPKLAFSVRLPPAWKKINTSSVSAISNTPDVLSTVTEYVSPDAADTRSFFRVRVATLPFAISAKNWLLKFIVTNNYTLQGLDEVNEKRIAAQYVYVEGGIQYVSRSVMMIKGNRVILVEMIMPVSVWSEKRDVAVWSMITFKLTDTNNKDPMEVMIEHNMADVLKFSYPKSWLIHKEPIRSIERMSAILVNVRGGSEGRKIESVSDIMALELDGRMDITSFTKKDPQVLATEMSALKNKISNASFELGDYLGEFKIEGLNKNILQSRTDIYKISSSKLRIVDYELWITVVETGNRYVIIQTLSIGRHNDFYAWARNYEALQLLMKSLVTK